jgi:hypothetical protein
MSGATAISASIAISTPAVKKLVSKPGVVFLCGQMLK